jgi:hypothetical protein
MPPQPLGYLLGDDAAAPRLTPAMQDPSGQFGAGGLTPQENYLYWQHLANLYGPDKVVGSQGVSTLYQMPAQGPSGRWYNIPTVWGGQILTPPEATQRAAQAGWRNWPSYLTPLAADLAYEARVHPLASQDLPRYFASHGDPTLWGR